MNERELQIKKSEELDRLVAELANGEKGKFQLAATQREFGKAASDSVRFCIELQRARDEVKRLTETNERLQAACAEMHNIIFTISKLSNLQDGTNPIEALISIDGYIDKHFKSDNPGAPLLERLKQAEAKCAEMRQHLVLPAINRKGFYCVVCNNGQRRDEHEFSCTQDGTEKHAAGCILAGENPGTPLLKELNRLREDVKHLREICAGNEEELRIVRERLTRAEETCAVVYQWAGANDFPVELLDNLSIIMEGEQGKETAERPYHEELPVAIDLQRNLRERNAALERVRQPAERALALSSVSGDEALKETLAALPKAKEG